LEIKPDMAMNDASWGAVCDLIKTLTHPTLQVLDFATYHPYGVTAVINSRIPVLIQALVNMLKVNVSIHTITWYPRLDTHNSELFQGSVVPYLETNGGCASRHPANSPISYRARVLGRALLLEPTPIYSGCFSQNAEIAFPSTTANIPNYCRYFKCFCFHFCYWCPGAANDAILLIV
jgi:hypothetical protein